MSIEAQLIRDLAEDSPGAARLAPLVSLAVLIEPQLLRRARIELLKDVDAGAEADLWLSPLVQTRSPRGIVLRPRAAEELRRELARDPALFDRAAQLTADVHRASGPTILLEEEINQLSARLEGESRARVEQLLHTVTNTLLREEGRRGLANWAASALTRLPEAVKRLEAARVLAAVAYLRLSSHLPPQSDSPADNLPPWLSWAIPKDLPSFALGVRLVEGGVQFGDPPEPGRSISVPHTNPLLVELSWREQGRERVRQVRLAPGERLKVETPPGVVRLRTARGDHYIINPASAAASARPDADEAGRETCFVVMGFGKKTDFETGRTLDLEKTYRNIIKPAVRDAGLKCLRADEISHKGVIDVPMYELLLKAEFVIADLSTSNKNALYELGVRHALRPHTTIVICEDGAKSFPFDVNHVLIRQYHHLGAGIDFDEAQRFRGELTKTLVELAGREPRPIDSPVYTFLQGLVPPTLDEAAAASRAPTASEEARPASGALSELLEQADDVQQAGDFGSARAMLNLLRRRAREAAPERPEDPDIIRRLALVTYKSGQPNPQAALEEARDLLSTLDPSTTNDAETLALWADVHTRLWNTTGNRAHLDEAARASERRLYLRNDHRDGVTYAYLLNLLAAHATTPADAIADFVRAEMVRREVIALCERWLSDPSLTPNDRDELSASLAEAYLGSGEPEPAERYYAALNRDAPSAWIAEAWERRERLEPLLANSPLKYMTGAA